MNDKREIAKDLDFIKRVSPEDYIEIKNLIKYTKKLSEMKRAKKEGEGNVKFIN
ncbi:hypothetical protein QTI06_14645 [Clostridium perfringens]|nr:hypothetical protein [Clostridium perfringens]